jgi:hypothetical protein
MKLTKHLEHVIDLIDRRSSYAEIKSSVLAMHEEVSGYEQAAANAIELGKKQPPVETLSAPETTQRLIEILNAIQEMKKQLEEINKPLWL